MGKEHMIAVCGIICDECLIFKAPNDPESAQKVVDWLKREKGEDVKPEQISCMGCRGDRTQHWSEDCEIMLCCIDEKKLDYCHECGDFPCEKIDEFVTYGEKYKEAIERLESMRAGTYLSTDSQ
jgi:hypothetical protein